MGDGMELDLNQLVEAMSEEERDFFLKNSASDYYRYLESHEEFQNILEKINQSHKLTDSEWNYIISKLFIVSCRALMEEAKVDFLDRLYILIGNIGTKIGRKDKPLYNECFKMLEYARSFKQEADINDDLLNGLDIVSERKQETDLDILLRQYEEGNIFRSNQVAFMEAYEKTETGVVSFDERMYMNAFQRAYQREKELVKKIGQK